MTKKGNCGEREGRGETTISVWEDTRFFLLPSPPIVTWTSASPPQTAYLRAFRTVLFAFSLSANWKAAPLYTPCIPIPCPSPLSFLSFILSPLHPTSVPSPSLLLLAFRASSDCLLFAYLRVAIRPHFLSFIIALLFFFTAASMLEEEGKIVTLWLNEVLERCWNFVLALHGRTDLLWISYERISSNSRARSESENALLKKLIIDHPSNKQIEAIRPWW